MDIGFFYHQIKSHSNFPCILIFFVLDSSYIVVDIEVYCRILNFVTLVFLAQDFELCTLVGDNKLYQHFGIGRRIKSLLTSLSYMLSIC